MSPNKKQPEQTETTPSFKSGLITLIGRSNVGKSTLLNTLIGQKVAIVTHKPQTTRNIIHGVLNTSQGQAVFIDTPGIFKEKRNPLSGKMIERVEESLQDINLIIYVVDPTKAIGAEERFNMSLLRKSDVPKILVINKCDMPEKDKEFLEDYRAIGDQFNAVFELSALKDRHVEPLRQKVFEFLPEGEPYYPPGQISNTDEEFWIAEVVREKIFLALRQEVPYSTHVEVESVEDKGNVLVIKIRVLTHSKEYKKMIIGKGGRAIKEIGIAARKELETALNKKVFLEIEVETDKRWTERV
ncbi:MAG TPA: GTPase Era [Candidatus Magasanikbacteria bacterium]|nr:GTPase Era [Candidatus Magasanikbacteria bacterium]